MNGLKRAFAAILAAGCVVSALACTACGTKNAVDPKTLFPNAEDLTFDGKSVTFPTPFTEKVFEGGTADGSFAVSYTVEGGTENIDGFEWYWVNTGGLYVELEDGTWHNIIIYQHPNNEAIVRDAFAVIWIIEGEGEKLTSEGAYYKTTLPFAVSRYPMNVKIAYYNEAYYFRLENTYSVKLDVSSEFTDEIRIDKTKLFGSGQRKVGFRTAETAATFKNISFSTGEEAALDAIRSMKLSV